jgi:hypothetical protein
MVYAEDRLTMREAIVRVMELELDPSLLLTIKQQHSDFPLVREMDSEAN